MSGAASETMRKTVLERELFGPDNAGVLMVSGGSDSTALAYLISDLHKAEEIGPIAILHVDHQLRGEESKADAAFVKSLADLLDIPFFLLEIDIAAEAERCNENIEALARRERYIAANDALASLCRHTGVPFSDGRILTAHSLDDRIENFYMRSIVGTGPGGFRSMLYRNGPVVRPLLDCTREELREYLTHRKESGASVMQDADGNLWREDSTNAHTDRFRAFVRHNIVPMAKEWSAQAPSNLMRTMNLIADEDDMLEKMTDELIETDVNGIRDDDLTLGFILSPTFGIAQVPLQRRAIHRLLKGMLGADERINATSVAAITDAFADGGCKEAKPIGGYVGNIQGNLAVSANKSGVRVEHMEDFRARRKRK